LLFLVEDRGNFKALFGWKIKTGTGYENLTDERSAKNRGQVRISFGKKAVGRDIVRTGNMLVYGIEMINQ